MRVRFTPDALGDLEGIHAYISQDNPKAASKVLVHIRDGIRVLGRYSEIGRAGTVEGTREFVLPRLPYIVVYQVAEGEIHILNIFHGAQDRT